MLLALGCGGESKSSFREPAGNGGSGASGGGGGSAATGGSTSTAGRSGDGSGANGGAAGASGSSGSTHGGDTGGSTGASGGTPGGGGLGGGAPSAGNANGGAEAAGAGGAEPSGPLTGEWGMFWWEDPVTVSIQQTGQAITGYGCCSGLPRGGIEPFCCGTVTGTSTEARASFAFALEPVGGMPVYATDVYVSEDKQRLGGTFSAGGNGDVAVAWVHVDPQFGGVGPVPSSLIDAMVERFGGFELTLSSALVDRFQPLTPYELWLGNGFIRGAFGPFYFGEMTWNAETQTLMVGPVPATDPSFAMKLELIFSGALLKTVIATYPDESPYFFTVTGTKG